MGQDIYRGDAFTTTPFAGNPAAVCVLPEAATEHWMQDVAREMNLSETAFLVDSEDGYSLGWFTPLVEVDLCGHATLASAHVLWETPPQPHQVSGSSGGGAPGVGELERVSHGDPVLHGSERANGSILSTAIGNQCNRTVGRRCLSHPVTGCIDQVPGILEIYHAPVIFLSAHGRDELIDGPWGISKGRLLQ